MSLNPSSRSRIDLLYAIAGCTLLCALSSCTNFDWGKVQPPAGTSVTQQQSDTVQCKDRARLAAHSGERETQDYVESQQQERAEFASCMHAKGYTVAPD
jgi:hypothetical protein